MRLARVVPLALGAAALLVLGTAGATSAGHALEGGRHADRDRRRDRPDEEHGAVRRARARGGEDRDRQDQRGRRRRRPSARDQDLNDQLDPTQTKADATSSSSEGVNIGWVTTCDVDYATPAIQAFLPAKLLTVAPCIGTDQMGPSRFGSAGQARVLVRQRRAGRGRAMAEWAYSRGWKTADVVTDKLLVYFQNVCTAFTTASSSSAARSSTRSRSRRATRRSTTSPRASTASRRR